MPTPATDFRLYHSNMLDLLAELLARELRQPLPGHSPLQPDIVLIPQVAMRRWLQKALAERFGIAANLDFLTPGEFVSRALDANLGASDDDLDRDSLHWRLYAALGDPALLAAPALAQIAAHVGAGGPARRWALAGELAGVFHKYSAWRRDWLLRWDAGADPDDPQALLWRTVAAGKSHRARRIQSYLERFETGTDLPIGLPPRLFAFATLNISPDVLRVLATQARVGSLHFYLSSPVHDYWGDLQPRRAGDPDENPLLRDWGAAGRDFIALLGSYEVIHPSGEIDSHADPAGGSRGFAGSLLRQLQSDLYHRRPAQAPLRAAVDQADPSLQFHACHTRLRELQVLSDRLRALLDPHSPEGRRFEPPLQPREIAVLAPDIDQYAPYLEAVFGGGDSGSRIPYALADTSPLRDEPLAALFLRLLGLSSSRFGLDEVLDLLASPPLAEASGLGERDLERLHGWLRQAGARWGLDAGHRARSGAPEEAAFTWQFALDRLLLGHASGSEDEIAGVAPWPQLEGGALEALDRLLRLLRELARHERLQREPATPAQWRERLLGLLEALLPVTPASTAGQRALERLRKLIDDFAAQAARAGVDAALPAEVVRAHFSAVLTEADTRAPLLTGGVSVARMVPMRLLPFRVICLLGMNDGEFPRRDPAAGLNRLTAEIARGQRQPGDRSTRDDDRFLFLQLLAAAQDVFYLSWLGASPRDGSDREPSPLVSELLASAAGLHADAEPAARKLVLLHPLQPFSQAMFGDGEDPRRYSYQRAWQPAARPQADARSRLPAWLPATTALSVAAPEAAATTCTLVELRRFFKAPATVFLQQRLGLRLPEIAAATEDVEPLVGAPGGLEKYGVQRAVFDGLMRGEAAPRLLHSLRARALLPSGPSGQRALDALLAEIAPYAEAFAQWRGAAQPQVLSLEVEIDGLRLRGQLPDVYPQGIARLRFGEPNGPSVLRTGLDWLLACAAGGERPFVAFHEDSHAGIGPHLRAPVPPAQAIAALRELLALREGGLQQPLLFAPYSSWALHQRREDPGKGMQEAAKKWRGHERGFAEGRDASLQLALRGRDPFADADDASEFARVSGLVFGAVTTASPQAIALGDAPLPEAEEAEDAA